VLSLEMCVEPGGPVERERPWLSLVDIAALAAGTQLLRLKLHRCHHLTNFAALATLNLQTLDVSWCTAVSDLAPSQPW
jgi:hypothetical protein